VIVGALVIQLNYIVKTDTTWCSIECVQKAFPGIQNEKILILNTFCRQPASISVLDLLLDMM
jgi:hypothetical protein